MKEIINNQEGETMINQQEVMVGNSTADGDMCCTMQATDTIQVNDGSQMGFIQGVYDNQTDYSQNTVYNQSGYVQGTPVNPALEAFYSIPSYQENNPYVIEDKKRSYTGIESCFAWMCFVFGYLFCKVFPVHTSPLGGFLFVLLIFTATTIVLKAKKAKLGVMPVVTAISAVVVSGTLILSSNEQLEICAYVYCMLAYCYYIFAATGNSTKKGFNDFIVVDYYKSLFVAPFEKLGNMLRGMFSGKAKKSGDVIGKVIKGGLIAFVPTLVVCGLLCYDEGFSNIIENIFDFDIGKILSNILCMLLGILVGQFIFRLFIASCDNVCKDKCSQEECVNALKSMQKFHIITTLSAVLPILFLYVVFFISQWKYYMSAFSGKLPSGFSYADYAREGFFQLCVVSVINMVIIIFVELFMNAKEAWVAKVKSTVVITYAVCTLILIATAISKMVLYIDSYGLTPKRVYSSWLMLVLAVIFLVLIIKQFAKKLQAVAVSFAVVVVMFSALALSNVDGLIARYNVQQYLEGDLESVDVWALWELGDAAVPELVYLLEELEDRGAVGTDSYASSLYDRTQSVLEDIALDYDNEDRQVMSYTIPYLKAKEALEDAGIKSAYYEW